MANVGMESAELLRVSDTNVQFRKNKRNAGFEVHLNLNHVTGDHYIKHGCFPI